MEMKKWFIYETLDENVQGPKYEEATIRNN